MRAPQPFELPEPEGDMDQKALDDIRAYGWHAMLVAPRAGDEASADGLDWFAYTVGVWGSFGQPEIILVGAWEHRHHYLSRVVSPIQEGQHFKAGDTTDDVLDGFPVRFDAVGGPARQELLTFSDWVNLRRPFDAIQLVLPDPQGNWPEDPAYGSFPQHSLV